MTVHSRPIRTGDEAGSHATVSSMDGNVVVCAEPGAIHPEWTLTEDTLPESALHDGAVELLRALLVYWARQRPDVQIARNLGIRWNRAAPQMGLDPDVCVLDPAPPEGSKVASICTWRAGHFVPKLAIEVVSETQPRKDYDVAPSKVAASGTPELWIFDPLLAGPRADGGPHLLQVWCRRDGGDLARVYAGEGPAYSPYLDAYLVVVGGMLRIASDPSGARLWNTGEEAERIAKEAERAAKEAERAAKEAERAAKDAALAGEEAALARVAELEALLRARGG